MLSKMETFWIWAPECQCFLFSSKILFEIRPKRMQLLKRSYLIQKGVNSNQHKGPNEERNDWHWGYQGHLQLFSKRSHCLTPHFVAPCSSLFLSSSSCIVIFTPRLPVTGGMTKIYLSFWSSTITCTQIITSLRTTPASLHSQLLLCIWSYNHSPTVHLMGLLAADQI